MSFQASHLQFALRVKELVKARDLTRYLSGTIYPDSRYLTGLERKLTHTRIAPGLISSLDDAFIKGWQVHLWYDKLGLHHLDQLILNRSWVPADAEDVKVWTQLTGAKLVEDLHWWQNTDWPQILPFLKFTANPYNEEEKILQNWYQHFINFYQKQPNLQNYRQQAEFMGIAPEKIELIMEHAQNLYNDRAKRTQIEKVMEQVAEEFKNLIISK